MLRALPPKSVRHCNILARPMLLCGSEIWALRKDTKRRLRAAEVNRPQGTVHQDGQEEKRRDTGELRSRAAVTKKIKD